ncbi:caspase family protein [Streptomyces sp. NPDC029004]|uniref:caspase, EACC1-associated type n=1 Tax=Streptomyces sp. NPDC029004 TaxID=3154490 RepID=UPI0034006CD8
MGRRLALLIATYDYQDSGLRQLTAPGHDAEAFAAVLKDPDIAGFEVTTLINEPHHRVGKAIGDLYRDRRRDDLTLLYFTGHGLKDDEGRLYLAMANTQRDSLLFTALSAEQIDQAMSGCMSRQQVLILDCCYSGAFPARHLAKADTAVHALAPFQGRGRTVLTASDALQYSFEGSQLHGEAARSVFTRHLVAGLRGGSADLDGDGSITLDELYSYVYDRVVDEMPHQRPKKQDSIEGRIVIARNINWTLPVHLRNALSSPIATERLAALDGLAHLHRIGNDFVRQRVTSEIQRLTGDDSRAVSAAARDRLQAILPQTPESPPASAPKPASASSPTPTSATAPATKPTSSEVQARQPPPEPATAEQPPTAAPQQTSAFPAQHGQPRPRLNAAAAPRPAAPEDHQAAATQPPPARSQSAKKTTPTPPEYRRARLEQTAPSKTTRPRTGEEAEHAPAAQGQSPVLPKAARTGTMGVTKVTDESTPAGHTAQPHPGPLPASTNTQPMPRRRILVAAGAALTILGIPAGILALNHPDGANHTGDTPTSSPSTPASTRPALNVRPLAPLTGHADSVASVVFSPDGKTLASSSTDGTVRLWDVATHHQLDKPLTGHTGTVYTLMFSPDGKTLASGSADGTVRLWDVATHHQLDKPLTGHTGTVSSVVFSPDGKTLASSSADGTVRLWRLE